MMAKKPEAPQHFNQTPRRKADFIKADFSLKNKVGTGGLSDDILSKAQALLENNAVDFLPLGEMYLGALMRGIERAQKKYGEEDSESLITNMLYPAMQLKANGGMFHYQLVNKIADKLMQALDEACMRYFERDKKAGEIHENMTGDYSENF